MQIEFRGVTRLINCLFNWSFLLVTRQIDHWPSLIMPLQPPKNPQWTMIEHLLCTENCHWVTTSNIQSILLLFFTNLVDFVMIWFAHWIIELGISVLGFMVFFIRFLLFRPSSFYSLWSDLMVYCKDFAILVDDLCFDS